MHSPCHTVSALGSSSACPSKSSQTLQKIIWRTINLTLKTKVNQQNFTHFPAQSIHFCIHFCLVVDFIDLGNQHFFHAFFIKIKKET